MNGPFKFLKDEVDSEILVPAAEKHLESLCRLRDSFKGQIGESFIQRYIDAFSVTGSPFVVNLDLNASEAAGDLDKMIETAKHVTSMMEETVRATARNVSGYKMNEQSMHAFLDAGKLKTVFRLKELYAEETGVEPVLWIDEKVRDIPSTTYQTACIIYTYGYDAIHCMPQIGPDVAGALQLAAEKFGKGTVHVINLTHPGYKHVKEKYFKDPVETINLMRKEALDFNVEVQIGEKMIPVRVRATGTIEPANRPDELFRSVRTYGEDKIMIISIGIGPQGALPGCALYAGAHVEGTGRFIFEKNKGFEMPEDMETKTLACKRSCLRALDARYSKEAKQYPLYDIMMELADHTSQVAISSKTLKGLNEIYIIKDRYR